MRDLVVLGPFIVVLDADVERRPPAHPVVVDDDRVEARADVRPGQRRVEAGAGARTGRVQAQVTVVQRRQRPQHGDIPPRVASSYISKIIF